MHHNMICDKIVVFKNNNAKIIDIHENNRKQKLMSHTSSIQMKKTILFGKNYFTPIKNNSKKLKPKKKSIQIIVNVFIYKKGIYIIYDLLVFLF